MQIEKKQTPPCTICIPDEKKESIVTQEYERRENDFQALFNRYPYLKDIICKMKPVEMQNLIKEKLQTTYDTDYNLNHRDYTTISVAKETKYDDDNELVKIKRGERGRLKKNVVQTSGLKYTGIAPPEPYIVPISEYRSTIHAIGTRIIKEQLLNPKVK